MTPDVLKKLYDLNMSVAPHRNQLEVACSTVGRAPSPSGYVSPSDLSNCIRRYVEAEVEYQVYRICSSPEFFNMIVSGASDVEQKDGL